MRLCLRLPIECSSCVIHRNAMRQNRERREARFQLIRLRRTDSDFNSYCPSNLSNSPPFFRILPRCPPISLVSWGGAENCYGRGPGYLWSPDDGKGRGSNLQPRRVPSETGHRKNKEPEPPGTTQVTRGPWRSNPPSESQPAASGWKRVDAHAGVGLFEFAGRRGVSVSGPGSTLRRSDH